MVRFGVRVKFMVRLGVMVKFMLRVLDVRVRFMARFRVRA
jgi:hypothetical protein